MFKIKLGKMPDIDKITADLQREFTSGALKGGDVSKSPITKHIPKLTAAMVKRNIERGGFDALRESTKAIRRWRGYTGTKPLVETGNLLDSVKDEGGKIVYADYGKYHLVKHKVKESYFSEKWGTTDKPVPARNFLQAPTQKTKGVSRAGTGSVAPVLTEEIIERELQKIINKIFKGFR